MAKYTSVSISGYNATPPSDDGTVSEANKIKWSTEKTKLTDPIKTALESINTNLVSAFDVGPTSLVSNTTLGASHYGDFIQVSGSGVTLTLTDAATLTAGWHCKVVNTDSTNTVTIGRATVGDTINSTAANISLLPYQAITIFVNAAANGFIITADRSHSKSERLEGSIWFAKGADIASATTTNIWSTDGNSVHITGTTTITSLGTAPQAGSEKWVIFDGALTLTHGANLNLPGSANITTAAGDFARVYANTTTQHYVQYFKISGLPTVIPSIDVQTFTVAGANTWTKPSGFASTTRVLLQAWGGGGGGANGNGTDGAGGGGGGAYAERWLTLADLGATETVTVGAGGTGSVGAGDGTAGGNTTIGSLLTAYGGGRGTDQTGGTSGTGGGGGGALGAGGDSTAGSLGGGAGGTVGAPGTNGSIPSDPWGGGGGAGGCTLNSAAGGNAVYGGAGGGADGTSGGSGGTSLYGGNGGAGGVAGTQPGGGGGGRKSAAGGNGGAGKAIITVYR